MVGFYRGVNFKNIFRVRVRVRIRVRIRFRIRVRLMIRVRVWVCICSDCLDDNLGTLPCNVLNFRTYALSVLEQVKRVDRETVVV